MMFFFSLSVLTYEDICFVLEIKASHKNQALVLRPKPESPESQNKDEERLQNPHASKLHSPLRVNIGFCK